MKKFKFLHMVFAVVLGLSLVVPKEANAQGTWDFGAIVQFIKKVAQDIQRIKLTVQDGIVNSKAFVAMGGAVKKAKAGLASARAFADEKVAKAKAAAQIKLVKEAKDKAEAEVEAAKKANEDLKNLSEKAAEEALATEKAAAETREETKEAGKRAEEARKVGEDADQLDSEWITPIKGQKDETVPPPQFRTSPVSGGQSFLRNEITMAFAAGLEGSVAACSVDGVFICSSQLLAYCDIGDVEDLKDTGVMVACQKKLAECMTDNSHLVVAECKRIYDGIMKDTVLNATAEMMKDKIESSQFIEKELKPLAEETSQDADIMSHIASLAKTNEMIQRQLNRLIKVYSTYIAMDTLGKLPSFDGDATGAKNEGSE